MHRAAVIALVLFALAVLTTGCAMAPQAGGGQAAPQKPAQELRRDDAQTASPQDLVARHTARIEAQRARLGLSGEAREAAEHLEPEEKQGQKFEASPGMGGPGLDGADKGGEDVVVRELSEAKQTGAAAGARPEPAPALDACEQTCTLAQDICVSSETICEVARGHAGEPEFAESCAWAQSSCDEALEVCTSCRQPIVQGE